MPPSVVQDVFPSTPGKFKLESRSNYFGRVSSRWQSSGSGRFFFWSFVSVALMFYAFVHISAPPAVHTKHFHNRVLTRWGGGWENDEKALRSSARVKRENGMMVLVTGAAGFVGSHVSLALKKRGDGLIGLDNFNNYYDPSLKRERERQLKAHGIQIIEGDINDAVLLQKLFTKFRFTHVMHLAAQAGVRYAMQNPSSYVHSNIAGLVTLFEACKSATPQPAIVWASSSSVYGLNEKVPFSERDRTDQPASLYAATKKAGEEIAHTYNHIYGLSITGLRFFTVYGPMGRPDMAYFSFTNDILRGKPINIYQGPNDADLARDFTYIDDIVKGCLGALDTATPSTGTGTGSKKKRRAQLRVFNLGNTSPVTVPTLVNLLEKHLKVKAKRNIVKMPRNGDVAFTHANITLGRSELKYNPTTDLETGLKKFVKWYEVYYGINSRKQQGKFRESS